MCLAGEKESGEDIYREALELHREHRGKIETRVKVPLSTRNDLSRAYSPGVAAVCRGIRTYPMSAYRLTMKGNAIAIVTDGSAVLGLGNIGGLAAVPVMEGKAAIFREFAGIDAYPVCFDTYFPGITDAIRHIAPAFGGINLEDIAAPHCFQIEDDLQDIGIPVMHDDQHGTAITVLAALINACRVTGKEFADLRIVISGAGAAGYAIARILRCIGYSADLCDMVGDIIVCDRQGIIHRKRAGLYRNKYKFILASDTNRAGMTGTLADAVEGADVFIGVSAPALLTEAMIQTMNDNPIVFAMANPVPEIWPEAARQGGARIVGTGRSDYPNQINNALAFPGVFRGALDASATGISDEMKVAAAEALARYHTHPTEEDLMPSVLDRGLVQAVAAAVREAAFASGCGREV
ncbi:NADP-dependent malic enzyme [Methanogenium sp. S4BF]|uniref:NAD(P)-dependent malic enzyme n=1 Tax=Methanogenium sp. S4BF TaxID=1789226 RepID=UPI0024171B12|nr:NADP-dependent malic enzyme [Methanogenium sp. S4BF]WFN34494.1 NADP-dependent malic enzyme [Methanogenium sp. S4BF]